LGHPVCHGISDDFRLYAQSQLYDLVEAAIAGKPAPWTTALRLGSAGLMFRLADELMCVFFSKNNTELHVSKLTDLLLLWIRATNTEP
jgi:hypothetical protein